MDFISAHPVEYSFYKYFRLFYCYKFAEIEKKLTPN